jgi:hypothetical protein
METIADLKERLHILLDSIENIELLEKIELLIYSKNIVEETLTDEEIFIVEKRKEAYLKGEGKTLSWEDVKLYARASKNYKI